MSIENNFVGPKPTFEKDGVTEVNVEAHINEARNYALTHNPLDILQWFKSKVSNYGDMTNPIFDSFINKATSYANKFFAQSSARNLGHIPMILINHDICSLCGVCVSACQKEILEIKGGIIQINFKNMEENGTCDGCVACIGFCPEEAIEIY